LGIFPPNVERRAPNVERSPVISPSPLTTDNRQLLRQLTTLFGTGTSSAKQYQ
jgi:hypothetical protein